MEDAKRMKFDDDGDVEKEVNLVDYIAEEDELKHEAAAVLGGSNQNDCSYSEGYVKRQAVYACADCCDLKNEPAGICLGCSLNCHDGHAVYELYTKRNFRCDCGDTKFSTECKLQKEKDAADKNNKYNHNFNGLYCSCSRPYPDEEFDATLNDEEGEMIQCVVCEDWYHNIHLGQNKAPKFNNYAEMICEKCTEHCAFLGRYKPISVGEGTGKNMLGVFDEVKISAFKCGSYDSKFWTKKTILGEDEEPSSSGIGTKSPEKSAAKKRKIDENSVFPAGSFGGATFWPDTWRTFLCKCKDCMDMYEDLKVKFITDEEDTIKAYESKGLEDDHVEEENQTANFLSGLNHTTQLDMIAGYNDLKNGLMDYLKTFADSDRTVTPNDIKAFFEKLKRDRQSSSANRNHYF